MGRNRKSGERYPSGKLKPAAKPTAEPISGALYQRIRTHALKLGADPRLASELSRLNLFGELTIVQTTAGHRIAEIYGAYEGLTGLRRSTRSPSYERAYGGGMADSLAREEAEKWATIDFLELHGTLEQLLPRPPAIDRTDGTRHIRLHPLANAIEQLCVENRSISPALYEGVRSVLDYLAQKWGLTTVRKARAGSAKKPAASAKDKTEPPRPKINLDRQSWIETIRAMRPDLTPEQAGEAYDLAQALKQRAAFVRSRPKLSEDRTTRPSGTRVAADRATLQLKTKGGDDAA